MAGNEWVEQLEAFCFTAVVGINPDEAIRRLGADPYRRDGVRTFDECFWPADGPQWVQVGAVGAGVLVTEHNGWQGEEAVEPLSQGTRLACFFRNVQAVMRFVYAVDGEIVADFDPLLEVSPRAGDDPRQIDPALQGLPFGLFGAERSALTLMERLTGIPVEPGWLATPQRVVSLPPLPLALPR